MSAVSSLDFDAQGVATKFVEARRLARYLADYPGTPPPDLSSAYQCQEHAIGLWGDAVVGWKVGWIPEPFSEQFGAQRLVGPVFRRDLQYARTNTVARVPVFEHGFAAVEGEFILQLAADAPADRLDWSPELARPLVKAMYVGIEIASSPLRNINDFGPAVVVSDFGNNAGLLLGPEIADWQSRDPESLACETRIDGELVGRGSAASLSGGPLAALAFALSCNARRGRPLHAGDLVSTGAVTGVHPIAVGQSAEVNFGAAGILRCIALAVTPVT